MENKIFCGFCNKDIVPDRILQRPHYTGDDFNIEDIPLYGDSILWANERDADIHVYFGGNNELILVHDRCDFKDRVSINFCPFCGRKL